METVKKNDFVEIKFTGYSGGKVFDSNIPEDLKSISSEAKAEKTVVAIGQGMVVKGLDKSLEGKEIGKEYTIELSPEEGFGKRNRDLVKTLPLRIFTEKRINPYPGMALVLDDMIAKVVTVSGARVITDFNNPLAGKDLKYKFTIVKRVDDEKEKIETLFSFIFKFVPEFEIKEEIVVKGVKGLEGFVKVFSDRFKEIIGKSLKFELKEEKVEEKSEETKKSSI